MANNCEGCSRNCCQDFKITTEVKDPFALQETLKKFPFIHKTRVEIVFGPSSREKVVGIYNCDRFYKKSGGCKNYDTEPRPDFCYNTGGRSYPHSNCLLKNANL